MSSSSSSSGSSSSSSSSSDSADSKDLKLQQKRSRRDEKGPRRQPASPPRHRERSPPERPRGGRPDHPSPKRQRLPERPRRSLSPADQRDRRRPDSRGFSRDSRRPPPRDGRQADRDLDRGRGRDRSRERDDRQADRDVDRGRGRDRSRERDAGRGQGPRGGHPADRSPRGGDHADGRGDRHQGRYRRDSPRRSLSPSDRKARPPLPPREDTRECFKCAQVGHLARDCPNPPKEGGGRPDTRECYKCKKTGHIARDCPEAGGGDEGSGPIQWGTAEDREERQKKVEEKDLPAPEPEFGLSGKLAEESNTVKGVVVKFQLPNEAKIPKRRWRLYVFKGDKPLDPMHIHRQPAYMFGRERKIVDIPTDHPSCSKQHAVLCYRETQKEDEDGLLQKAVRPYIMDLGSVNGTFLNGERVESERFYELLEKDNLKFGNSSRDYVLLHAESAPDEDED